MRNRQLIVYGCAHTTAIDVRRRDGKTYYVMTDAVAFQEGVGRLLAEVQRIKSEGDYNAARRLFENTGSISTRRFVTKSSSVSIGSNSRHIPVSSCRDSSRGATRGEIVDVELSYPCDLETQMLGIPH